MVVGLLDQLKVFVIVPLVRLPEVSKRFVNERISNFFPPLCYLALSLSIFLLNRVRYIFMFVCDKSSAKCVDSPALKYSFFSFILIHSEFRCPSYCRITSRRSFASFDGPYSKKTSSKNFDKWLDLMWNSWVINSNISKTWANQLGNNGPKLHVLTHTQLLHGHTYIYHLYCIISCYVMPS